MWNKWAVPLTCSQNVSFYTKSLKKVSKVTCSGKIVGNAGERFPFCFRWGRTLLP